MVDMMNWKPITGSQEGKGDLPERAEPACPVDLCRVVDLRLDALQARQGDNHVVPGPFPRDQDVDGDLRHGRGGQPLGTWNAHLCQEKVHQPRAVVEEHVKDDGDGKHGRDVWQEVRRYGRSPCAAARGCSGPRQ